MIRKIAIPLILLLSIVSINSCKKETNETLMIVKNWKLVDVKVGKLSVATPCQKTQRWDFKKDNTYEIKPDCPLTKGSGTWEMSEDGEFVTLNGLGTYNIVESTPSTLILSLQIAGKGLHTYVFE